MTIPPGTRFGPCIVETPIAAGGMGEVYRARDTQLQRDVAIKVLPDLFAADPDRLTRFEREAHTLASLNHPHIAQIYGLERSGATRALIMELVEGEDLSQRLARGPLPLDEALRIAMQVAHALEAAHDRGIVHRDLKPANIKVRPDGTAKVLDFGLAKATDPASSSSMLNSPTFTSPPVAGTQLGVILGTAAYMAPEQARGKTTDRRADIWAFGVVLYEMLTGRRAFQGEDVSEVLASVLKDVPALEGLPAATPPSIRRLLRRCLVKDPRERLGDMSAARLEIADALNGDRDAQVAMPAMRPRRRGWLLWTVAAAAAAAAIGALAAVWLTRTEPERRVIRTVVEPPGNLTGPPALRLAISPDGRRVVFTAPNNEGQPMLWVRPLDSVIAQPLTGTVGGVSPFWSPDSGQIAFIAENKLKRIDANGGTAMTICAIAAAPPGSWSAENVILITSAQRIAKVAAAGGTPEPVTEIDTAVEGLHLSPFWLPDGQHFLYASATSASRVINVRLGRIGSAESTVLIPDATSNAMYAEGHLVYARDTILVARPFDPSRLVFTGDAFVIAEQIMVNPATGTAAFSLSQNGIIAYQTSAISRLSQLAWFDASGKLLTTIGGRDDYGSATLSPDGRSLAVTLSPPGSLQTDIWILDPARGVRSRLTDTGGFSPVWSADGSQVIYAARQAGQTRFVRKSASGVGPEEVLHTITGEGLAMGWSPDGKVLLYSIMSAMANGRLWAFTLDDRKERPVIGSNFSEVPASLSPDGAWLAYTSTESGAREVYVTTFPTPAGKWPVSVRGGESPRWSGDGRHLFFISSGRLMRAAVTVGAGGVAVGEVESLFDLPVVPGRGIPYDIAPDGRLLANVWQADPGVTPITILQNWTSLGAGRQAP